MTAERFWCGSTADVLGAACGHAGRAERATRRRAACASSGPQRHRRSRARRRVSQDLRAADRSADRHPHPRRGGLGRSTGDSPVASSSVHLTVSIALEVIAGARAEGAVEALKRSVAVRADVRRDGARRVDPGRGDRSRRRDRACRRRFRAGRRHRARSRRRAGQRIAAHRRGLSGRQARRDLAPRAIPAEAFNALFSGTVLVRGNAVMLVDGDRRGDALRRHRRRRWKRPTPPASLERGLHAFGVLIMRLTVFLVLFVLLAQSRLRRGRCSNPSCSRSRSPSA